MSSVCAFAADNIDRADRGKASSGVLHKWLEYSIRDLTPEEIAESERHRAERKEGKLENDLSCETVEMTDSAKTAFEKDGASLFTGAVGNRIFYDEVKVPVIGGDQSGGSALGKEFTIPKKAGNNRVVVHIGKLPQDMKTVNISAAFKGSTKAEWIMEIASETILVITPSKATADTLSLQVSTSENTSKTAKISIDTVTQE